MTLTETAARGLPEGGLKLMRRVASPYFSWRWDIHERGQGNVPEDGPVILASNHIGWLDGPLMFVKSPRPAHALVKEEEFVGRTGRLLRFVGQIKVSRTRNDTGALRRAAQALAAGQAVLIYPEGKRGAGTFDDFKGGVTWLSLVSGAPIVPVAIFGTRQPGEGSEARAPKGARLDIVYGKPLRFPMQAWPRDREILADAGEQIHEHLRSHVTWSQNALKRELPGPLPRDSTDG
ncbi:lysophospholipid acyltransferase family protein [Aeromicrobium panaciterrae]|uniref:lysophospholipid acyltransferase family protein n=1 Tax=Aeromicrobium panaciterrae TaxID=363861 RepID=UPI0031DD3E98